MTFAQRCCVCMAIGIRDTHRCIERSTDCDCPICGEYMFTSLRTVVFMTCGHSIHRRCYEEHIKTSYRCPICSRSIANMEWQFLRLQRAIETQPMPDEFKNTKAFIYCNDCLAKTTVKYHWLGLRCGVYVHPPSSEPLILLRTSTYILSIDATRTIQRNCLSSRIHPTPPHQIHHRHRPRPSIQPPPHGQAPGAAHAIALSPTSNLEPQPPSRRHPASSTPSLLPWLSPLNREPSTLSPQWPPHPFNSAAMLVLQTILTKILR